MTTAIQYAKALNRYAPHLDALGIDRDELMLELLYRSDGKGDGTPCGGGWISKRKKCSKKGAQKLAASLKAGDKGAIARVQAGKKKAGDRQSLSRAVIADKGKKARDIPAPPPDQPKARRKALTSDDVDKTPWSFSPSQYQAAKGVKEPWIAEISPMQLGNLSQRARKEYMAQRSKEWADSAAIKGEWADKVWSAHKAGGLKGNVSSEAKNVVFARTQAANKAAAAAALDKAQKENEIQSIDDVEIGDKISGNVVSGGIVTKKFKKSVRVMTPDGIEANRYIGEMLWRDKEDLPGLLKNGESIRPPRPVLPKEGKAKASSKRATIKPRDVSQDDFMGKDFSDNPEILNNARGTMKALGLFGVTAEKMFKVKSAIESSEKPEDYELIRIPGSGFTKTKYSAIRKKTDSLSLVRIPRHLYRISS